MFVQNWVIAVSVLVAVSVWQVASAEPVVLTSCILQPRYLMFFDAGVAHPLDSAHPQTPLRDRAKLLIDDIATGWRQDRSSLDIAGHEDEAEYRVSPNIDVLRAEAVKAALIQRGVDPKAITTRGEGFTVPMIPLPGPEMQNRYVSVTAIPANSGCGRTADRSLAQ